MRLEFFIPGVPKPAGSKRALPASGGQRFAQIVDANPQAKDWKAVVSWYARRAMMAADPTELPVRVEFQFIRERPKAHRRANGEIKEQCRFLWPVSKPDVLKLARGTEDAMTGIVWQDDSQIVVETLIKRYGTKPGCMVRVDSIERGEA